MLQGVYKVLKVLKSAKMVKVLKKVLKSAKINQKVLKNYSTKHKAIYYICLHILQGSGFVPLGELTLLQTPVTK